jgi:hypothetical protein
MSRVPKRDGRDKPGHDEIRSISVENPLGLARRQAGAARLRSAYLAAGLVANFEPT